MIFHKLLVKAFFFFLLLVLLQSLTKELRLALDFPFSCLSLLSSGLPGLHNAQIGLPCVHRGIRALQRQCQSQATTWQSSQDSLGIAHGLFFTLQFVREKGEKIQIYSLQELKKKSKLFRLSLHKNEHIYHNYYITQFVHNIRHISLELVTDSKAVLKVH